MKAIFTLLFLICTLFVFAQDGERGGRIESLKIAFLTKKLNLSPEEAQRFWPIYNNYAGEIRQHVLSKGKTSLPKLKRKKRF